MECRHNLLLALLHCHKRIPFLKSISKLVRKVRTIYNNISFSFHFTCILTPNCLIEKLQKLINIREYDFPSPYSNKYKPNQTIKTIPDIVCAYCYLAFS